MSSVLVQQSVCGCWAVRLLGDEGEGGGFAGVIVGDVLLLRGEEEKGERGRCVWLCFVLFCI